MAFDIVGLVRGDAEWFRISFWMIAAGIIGGLLAAIFGLADWVAIPAGTRAQRIGLWHGAGNVLVVLYELAGLKASETPSSRSKRYSSSLSFFG